MAAKAPASIVGKSGTICCKSPMSPQMRIITPKARPTIAPPCGIPKHSSSRLRSYLREGGAVSRLAPHLTQTKASSSFLAPHLVQYTMNFILLHCDGFYFSLNLKSFVVR